jgi:hypothetical protein
LLIGKGVVPEHYFLKTSEDRISGLFNISTANRVLYSFRDF